MVEAKSVLADLRKRNKITQETLARNINVTVQTVKNWESGYSKPQAENIRKLALFFGVSSDIFL